MVTTNNAVIAIACCGQGRVQLAVTEADERAGTARWQSAKQAVVPAMIGGRSPKKLRPQTVLALRGAGAVDAMEWRISRFDAATGDRL
jgi:hypothetical protein